MLRKLTENDDVCFLIEAHPEDIPIAGNCSAIDPEIDEETERWVIDQLDRGNDWAWCTVILKARWREFEGRDVLGCCSYLSQDEFERCGYFDDMKKQALADLNTRIAHIDDEIDALRI